MNIYLISQTENNDYDTFDSAIVCAESEEEAKTIHPSTLDYNSELKTWGFDAGTGGRTEFEPCGDYGAWCNSPSQVKVKYIGEADKSIKKGVICASFNAG